LKTGTKIASLTALLLLGGCVSLPSGPSAMVLPGSTKSFDQFRADDMDCRGFASSQIGGTTPNQAAANSVVSSAVIGTAIGAVAGAAFGGSSGAAVGAGTGLLIGSATGASAGGYSQYELQRRYDAGYQQCMYSRGHKVPVAGRYDSTPRPVTRYTPPPPPPGASAPASASIPPPPAGAPPPPPPGVN
jgi:YMGG-like Gly-zipper